VKVVHTALTLEGWSMTTLERGTATTMETDEGGDAASLGEMLRRARRARGFSQEQLAEIVGISAPYVSLIEKGKRGHVQGVSYNVLLRIADALAIPKVEFLRAGGYDAEFRSTQDEAVVSAVLAHELLRDDQKQVLIATFRSMLGRVV
jgi:transcriptional regulator with XRE-family HTH domain